MLPCNITQQTCLEGISKKRDNFLTKKECKDFFWIMNGSIKVRFLTKACVNARSIRSTHRTNTKNNFFYLHLIIKLYNIH